MQIHIEESVRLPINKITVYHSGSELRALDSPVICIEAHKTIIHTQHTSCK